MSSVSRSFLEFCKDAGLTQVVYEATVGDNVWDLVLSSDPKIIRDLRVGSPIDSSDHSPLDYEAANFEAIAAYLCSVEWYGSFGNAPTVDGKYEFFIPVLNHCIHIFVPIVELPPIKSYLPPHLKGSVSPQIHRPRICANPRLVYEAPPPFSNENTSAINEISGGVWQDVHLPCRGTLSTWRSSFAETPDHMLAFIKSLAPFIVRLLEHLFNLSFMKAEVPSRWKILYVTPIPKKSLHTSPENYRPIRITLIFARLIPKKSILFDKKIPFYDAALKKVTGDPKGVDSGQCQMGAHHEGFFNAEFAFLRKKAKYNGCGVMESVHTPLVPSKFSFFYQVSN
ncbi:hypothetical protein Y032_0955g3203 [Ancylostoma ceylanicum]|uniref:Uncharacterized protein n=1 Tax=Ancylostoma ceylanicum TaxID=53326 RepID=A0A016W8J6_9BILA|nr:hypothetical protein Y032_0955g3203 [Ancylostoma ceylanicum]